MDRRTVRTRQLLQDALIALMLEKEYDAITVQDITDHANLGRATFYLHYQSKEDLLLSTLEQIYDELTRRIEPHIPPKSADDPPPIQLVLEHAAENKNLYRVILRGAGNTSVFVRARDYMAQQLIDYLQDVIEDPDVPLPVTAIYLAGAQLNLIAWWLEENMPYTIEEMVRFYETLTIEGVASALGMQDLVQERLAARGELEQ